MHSCDTILHAKPVLLTCLSHERSSVYHTMYLSEAAIDLTPLLHVAHKAHKGVKQFQALHVVCCCSPDQLSKRLTLILLAV